MEGRASAIWLAASTTSPSAYRKVECAGVRRMSRDKAVMSEFGHCDVMVIGYYECYYYITYVLLLYVMPTYFMSLLLLPFTLLIRNTRYCE